MAQIYEVKDEQGNWHEVKTNLAGQKYRDAWSTGRFVVCLVILNAGGRYIRTQTDSEVLLVAGVILLIVLLRFFLLAVTLSKEELGTQRVRLAQSTKVTPNES